MKEWQVLINGEVWTDRFNSKDMAIDYIKEQVKEGVGEQWEFEVREMTGEDLKKYYP